MNNLSTIGMTYLKAKPVLPKSHQYTQEMTCKTKISNYLTPFILQSTHQH